MNYLVFTLLFTVLHAAAYTIAGAVIFNFSKDVYKGKSRIMDYLRDMNNPQESSHVTKRFFPAQLVRGVLMSLVLYPLLPLLGEISVLPRGVFLFGMMFCYTHIACAAPCPDNIEGYVYLREKYFSKSSFFKFQTEMTLYSLLFSIPGTFLLF